LAESGHAISMLICRDKCSVTVIELEELQADRTLHKTKLETLISNTFAWKIKSCNTLQKYTSRRGFACLEAIQKESTSPAAKDSLSFFKKINSFC